MIFRRARGGSGASLRARNIHEARRGEAGFSILEAFVALIILTVVGFAIHNVTLSGLRHLERARALARQAEELEYSVDWARANVCDLFGRFAAGQQEHSLTVDGKVVAVFRGGTDSVSHDVPRARVFTVTLPAGEHVDELTHTLVLDVTACQ